MISTSRKTTRITSQSGNCPASAERHDRRRPAAPCRRSGRAARRAGCAGRSAWRYSRRARPRCRPPTNTQKAIAVALAEDQPDRQRHRQQARQRDRLGRLSSSRVIRRSGRQRDGAAAVRGRGGDLGRPRRERRARRRARSDGPAGAVRDRRQADRRDQVEADAAERRLQLVEHRRHSRSRSSPPGATGTRSSILRIAGSPARRSRSRTQSSRPVIGDDRRSGCPADRTAAALPSSSRCR